jgi:hypothetical protein
MQYIMSANGAAAWERRCFLRQCFCAGVFCAGLSALTRCDFKNPARWAGLLYRRGSALVATGTGLGKPRGWFQKETD